MKATEERFNDAILVVICPLRAAPEKHTVLTGGKLAGRQLRRLVGGESVVTRP
jgi:hypothetical protein